MPDSFPTTAFALTVASVDSSEEVKQSSDYVCDGVADNVQIQAAIDSLPYGGGRIQLSGGKFILAAGVTVPSVENHSVNITGQGRYATVVYATPGITAFKYGNRATSGDACIGSSLKGMQLQCTTGGTGSGTSIGLDTDGLELCEFQDLLIEDFDIGIVLRNLDRTVLQTVRVGNPKLIGYKLVQAGTSVGGHNNWGTATFINCEWVLSENSSRGCVLTKEGNGSNPLARITWISSMLFASTTPTGTIGFDVTDIGVIAATFYNCIFENNLTHVKAATESHLSFMGCEFLRSGSDSDYVVNTSVFSTYSFYDCAFQRATAPFNGSGGSPRFYFFGESKNDGNLGTFFTGGSIGGRLGTDVAFVGTDTLAIGTSASSRHDYVFANHSVVADLRLTDGISAPDVEAGKAIIYVDTADGDLKIKYGDGTVKTIVIDT